MKNKCPLCLSEKIEFHSKDKKREYLICSRCKTIFVPKEFHLSSSKEKSRYDLHTNNPADPYYIEFLNRIIEPILTYVKTGSNGLDFGCGPGPILKSQFKKQNISIKEYDLFYKDDRSLLNKKWDFIVSTEVVEHLKEPGTVVKMLWDLINSGGILALMTSLYTVDTNFPSWYYKGDPTHICFFSRDSFYWLAKSLNADIEFFDKDITIFKKR